jgi:ribosome-binding ATPase YchF (GTP1/OBG family)
MQTAIVGLAGAGKTTVFNTLTRGHAETGGFGGMELHVGVVKVPDDRLGRLAEIFKPKKIVQADVTYVDLPAPPPSSDGHVGTEDLPAEHLARLRESDALVHVVRAFDDPSNPHPDGSVDPARDLDRLDVEFTIADLALVDRRLERLKTSGRHGTPAERESNEREEAVLVRIKPALEAGTPIRDVELDADEEKAIRGFRFLTQKPVLVLLNVGEGDITAAPAKVAEVAAAYDHRQALVDALSAKIEMELGELEPDEAAVFMEELGIA